MPFIIIPIILAVIALSTGYVTIDLTGSNNQEQTLPEQIKPFEPPIVVPTYTPPPTPTPTSTPSTPTPSVIIYQTPPNNEGLTANQELALKEIERKQDRILDNIQFKLGLVRQLLGGSATATFEEITKNPFKYIDICNDYCLQAVKKLYNEIDDLNEEHDQLEITRLQILGQR